MSYKPICKRRAYHTSVKFLTKRNLLPGNLFVQINRSLVYKWKNEPDEKYFGFALNDLADKHADLLAEFAHHVPAQKIFEAYLGICNLIAMLASQVKGFNKILRANKDKVIEVVEIASESLSLSKILQCLSISKSRYYNWYVEVKRKCRRSSLRLCLKTFPQQLTSTETGIIKRLLTDEKFISWPITSVALYALRENLVGASVNTWYKYAKLLGIQRCRPKYDKKKTLGIRAIKPNEYWHCDVTLYQMANGVKAYIYLLMDNFSRRILSWAVSERLSAATRLATIKDASNALPKPEVIQLIVDGGSENNNEIVESYIENTPLNKLIAQKDIKFSNSMIEAMNKILKHGYLAGKEFHSIPALETFLKEAIEDYNQTATFIPARAYSRGSLCGNGKD